MGLSGRVDGKRGHDEGDAELAQRAARRIGEYLTTHPGATWSGVAQPMN
jgi:hypothetical protein